MELELEQDVIVCYEVAGQATVCQEETQEAIVPDACPDILRLADVCAQAFVSRWEVREGQAAVIGYIQAAVLYIPESGHSLRKMEVKLPFTVHLEMSELTSDCVLEASARLRCADGRMLNPRKILLRADLTAEVTAFHRREYTVCTGAYQADEEKICQRITRVDHDRVVCVPQRIFPMSEEIRLTGAQAPEILSSRGECTCTESRVIGSKLVFKGKTDVTLLLQTQEGGLERRTETFPFSQILEVKGGGDGGNGQVHLELVELLCRPSADDPFRIVLDMEVLAQGQVRERENIGLLTDLYSTANHMTLEHQRLTLFSPGEQQVIPQTFRDMLETEDVVRSVCDSRFSLGPVRAVREGNFTVFSAQGQISILYLDEERQLRHMDKDVELSVRMDYPEKSRVRFRCCPGPLYAAPCAGGIEVRLNLEFCFWVEEPLWVENVNRAGIGEVRGREGVRPSVTLRRPEPGEELWDIAKACGTTKQRIMQANELSGEEIPGHKMLLIPGVR